MSILDNILKFLKGECKEELTQQNIFSELDIWYMVAMFLSGAIIPEDKKKELCMLILSNFENYFFYEGVVRGMLKIVADNSEGHERRINEIINKSTDDLYTTEETWNMIVELKKDFS